jgi:hypothetical protein
MASQKSSSALREPPAGYDDDMLATGVLDEGWLPQV